MRLSVLVVDGVFDAGLSLVLDCFDMAGALAPPTAPRLRVSLVGVRRRARTHLGLEVPVEAPGRAPDVAVVPALGAKTPEAIAACLARPDLADAVALLRDWWRAGATLSAACTGTFVLGEAGLLDGRRATTSWWLAPFFRERYPAVQLDASQMLVPARRLVTAGAALAHLDLALWWVRRVSRPLARTVANHLLHDARPSQAAFVMPDYLARAADPLVERFEAWASRNLDGFTMHAAARAMAASERTLERRVRASLGKSPLALVQDLRVAAAIERLGTTEASIDEIAAQVGYQDGATLRALLRRKTGRGVRELRRG